MIQTTQRTLHDGVRNAVIQITGVSDGSGTEDHVVKVDVSELKAKSVKIRKISYDVGYGLVKLSWDALDPVDFAMLSLQGEMDYSRIGGMINGGGGGVTGDILLTTSGFELNSSYTITFELVKKN